MARRRWLPQRRMYADEARRFDREQKRRAGEYCEKAAKRRRRTIESYD